MFGQMQEATTAKKRIPRAPRRGQSAPAGPDRSGNGLKCRQWKRVYSALHPYNEKFGDRRHFIGVEAPTLLLMAGGGPLLWVVTFLGQLRRKYRRIRECRSNDTG